MSSNLMVWVWKMEVLKLEGSGVGDGSWVLLSVGHFGVLKLEGSGVGDGLLWGGIGPNTIP